MTFSGQYLTYAEYTSLGGTLGEVPFNLLELNSRKYIDSKTENRLVELDEQLDEVKACILDLINLQVSINNGVDQSGNVINYTQKEIEAHRYAIVNQYLSNCKQEDEDTTPYLYCGVEDAS